MANQNEPPIIVTINLIVAEENRNLVLQTFRSLAGRTRGEQGCLACHLLENVQDHDELTFVEEWSSKHTFHRYIRSSAFRQLMRGLDLAAEEPSVRVKTAEGLGSFEYFEKVLASTSD